MYYREDENDDWHPLIIKADTDLSSLVEEYDATATGKTWQTGELCLHDAKVYCANNNVVMPKAWTASDWSETTLGAQIGGVKNTLNHKADVIYDTASGDIASFPDGADGLPVKDLTVGIEPVQDTSGGDPSPTNICPISGWTGANVSRTGKNLIDPDDIIASANIDSDGKIAQTAGNSGYKLALVYVAKGMLCTMSGSSDISNGCLYAFYTSKPEANDYSYNGQRTVQTNSRTFTAPIDGWVAVRYKTDDSSPQIEVGSTSSAYEPYVGTTLPISWQSSAGTVYGGTLDVTTGVLTVDRAMAEMGSESWTKVDGSGGEKRF